MEIKNAKIKFSFLGVDEEGILTTYLGFDYRDNYDWHTVKTNEIILLDISLIKELLNALEVRSWEELPRKFARVKIENGKVIAVGNLLEDKWVEIK